ncbi:Metallo-dependent phosphatase-like protein [Microdochium trichocladiopsis]|uniref:Metallo-dependent phosphatase-like protein n=1 Tax=Microdochium trichocladiopsis TaxID=1682393 RepID=A0A9P8Y9J0_9PEZI|nr:Metallo-dependent phosphatase-like protein [Microdochium trichocladiopsis]KAH7033587.1 Metallo-dependent phosphatase-like protein [Microdochium trichocladiopsis]
MPSPFAPGQFVLESSSTHPTQPVPNSHPAHQPLRFKSDGTFQISIFEDLHFGENAWDSWGPQQDLASIGVINSLLDSEPATDLVVLNGDLITGENTFLENATSYLDMIVSPIAARGKTWASTYGNHDHQYNISGETIFAREKSARWRGHSRTKSMVRGELAGTSNYYLPVYAADCAAPGGHAQEHGHEEEEAEEEDGGETIESHCTPELLLWFFDSKGGFRYQQKDPSTGEPIGLQNWVDISVVDWWQQTYAKLLARHHGAKRIPSMAFVHIPTYASLEFQRDVGVDPHTEPGINDDVPASPQAQGWCPDGSDKGTCSYGGQDLPFMQAVATMPGLMGVFSGHDHGNTWCYKWHEAALPLPGMMAVTGEGRINKKNNGVNLCFGQHTGYGGYGSWERGARQILVSRDQLALLEMDSWIRLESGNVVGSVSLNATYGEDEYPATKSTMTHCPKCN